MLRAGFFLCVVAGLLWDVQSASAQPARTVRSVRISGNSSVPSEELTAIMILQPGVRCLTSTVQSDSEQILKYYRTEGFLNAVIDSFHVDRAGEGEVDLLIMLREGKLSVVQDLLLDGAKTADVDEIKTSLKTRAGERFVPELLEDDIQSILQVYERKGRPLAKVSVGRITFAETENQMLAEVHLLIDEGRELRIREFRIEGNTKTKAAVIIREARLQEEELFQADLPGKVKRRLERLQLFSSVSMPELTMNEKEQAGLLVKVTEGNQNNFDGVVGYVPPLRPQDNGYFTGLVNLSLRNLLGTGRKISTRWYRENQSSQEIELHYFEPWVADYPVNVQLGFLQRKQDSLYVRTRYDVGAELMITEDLAAGATYSKTTVVPGEGYGRTAIAESQSTSIGISVRYDSRDDPTTPSSGILYSTEYQSGFKTTVGTTAFGGSRSSMQRISFDFLYYISPIVRQVVAMEFHARDYSSGTLDPSDLFRLGGATTLRGYREGQFLGSRLVWTNLEYRFLVSARSFFYGFLDLGRIVTPDSPLNGLTASEVQKIGYGLGVRMDSGIGLIGVSVALGEGDTFGTAKLHLRLVNEF
ncbi:MAG: POTRA domain-containing protein [Bacteroidota bacterium]